MIEQIKHVNYRVTDVIEGEDFFAKELRRQADKPRIFRSFFDYPDKKPIGSLVEEVYSANLQLQRMGIRIEGIFKSIDTYLDLEEKEKENPFDAEELKLV